MAKILEQVLRGEADPAKRLSLCNLFIESLAGIAGMNHLQDHKLVAARKSLLLEITPPHYGRSGIPRPQTSMVESSLFTGSPMEPQLVHELLEEMRSADEVDILISFIKWSGARLLMPGFENLREREVPVRLITTSYGRLGASSRRGAMSDQRYSLQSPYMLINLLAYPADYFRMHFQIANGAGKTMTAAGLKGAFKFQEFAREDE